MKFLLVLWEAAGPLRLRLALSVAGSTFGTIGILMVVNTVLDPEKHADGKPDLTGLVLFAFAASAVVVGQAVGQRISTAVIEDLLDRIRVRTVELVRRTDYGRFESNGGRSVYDVLSRNSAVMNEAAMMAMHGVGAFGALILGGFYTLMLSPLVFAVIAVVILSSSFFYRLSQRQTHGALAWASQVQDRFYALLRHLLDGFKEVKLHDSRGDDLEHRYLTPESGSLRDAQIDATKQINKGINVSYVFFYLMLGTIAFVLPSFVGEQRVIGMSVYVAVYMLGIVEVILKTVPTVTRASFAIDEFDAMEKSLQAAARDEAAARGAVDFQTIAGLDLLYSYFDRDGQRSFTMGPATLELSKGELLFVVGGNGSGKSTLLKTFTRLYQPQSGTLLWDGAPVDSTNVRAYRSLFSSVFSDFHLFDRLYGLEGVPEERVNALLAELDIAHKTAYRDGRFTNTDLSTGQRKRLALALALL
ncbi:MAG: ATP-binding cassette domain-containing protein, partial [Tistlia sp.]